MEEISDILGEKAELLSLKDINCHADIPETADTLEGNAMLKAEYIFESVRGIWWFMIYDLSLS